MDADQAMQKLERILEKIDPDDMLPFLHRARDRIRDELQAEGSDGDNNNDAIMDSIRETLRVSLPLSAVTKTETIIHPTVGPNSKMDPNHTIHVDAFLYDDDRFDELCDTGKLSRNYCTQCGSHSVKPLTVLTHSASLAQIKFIFLHLLPSLRDRILLDIGSRTGAVLYGAYLYSGCKNIVGVEIDSTFCKLQQQIVDDYNFSDRIQVHHQNILDNPSLISSSNVVILNNVFEFFLAKELQERMWRVLSEALKQPNMTLITIPSIEESLESLDILNEVNMDWLKPVDLRQKRKEAKLALFPSDPDNDELDNIFMYKT